MRTLEEYVDMIPTAPPDDIERYLDAMGRKAACCNKLPVHITG